MGSSRASAPMWSLSSEFMQIQKEVSAMHRSVSLMRCPTRSSPIFVLPPHSGGRVNNMHSTLYWGWLLLQALQNCHIGAGAVYMHNSSARHLQATCFLRFKIARCQHRIIVAH